MGGSMTSMSWWRSWHGAPTDHKWAVIAARSGVKTGIVSAVAWALFDYASQNAERGSVAGFDPEEYAVYSGFDEGEIIAVIQAMTDKGIITDGGTLTNWKKRQPEREDYSTPRVTKYRELKRNVTQCNAETKIVTDDSVSVSVSVSESESVNLINNSEIFSKIYRAYENEIGALTPVISGEIESVVNDYPVEWFEKAFMEAAKNNKRSWAYALAILKRWKVDGVSTGKNKNAAPAGQEWSAM